MLTLSRKPKEEITVTTKHGETVTICITAIRHGKVSLSFDAPESVKILRTELQRKNEAA